VALVPANVLQLTKAGIDVIVETGAGKAGGYTDKQYVQADARIAEQREDVFRNAEVILQVRTLGANPEAGQADLKHLRAKQVLIGFANPFKENLAVRKIADTGIILLAMELIPRITRAQSMDALSSMATIAGYKAVLSAAEMLPKMFPMMMTAAGTVKAARILVIGAGVAGLQAIATARRLGGIVQAYDLRPAVKEQVESLGARFVELPLEAADSEEKSGYARKMDETFYQRQRELLANVTAESDVVITTASVPAQKAPLLITEEMVRGMTAGSVIVDLAAESGGNCQLTQPGQTVNAHGVNILGPVNITSTVPHHASQMYSKNIYTFLLHLLKDNQIKIDLEDQITRETLVCRDGQIVHPKVLEIMCSPDTHAKERSGG